MHGICCTYTAAERNGMHTFRCSIASQSPSPTDTLRAGHSQLVARTVRQGTQQRSAAEPASCPQHAAIALGAHHEHSCHCPWAFAAALTAPFADDGIHGRTGCRARPTAF